MKPKLTLIRGGRYDEVRITPAPTPPPSNQPAPAPPKRESLYDVLVRAEARNQ
jgi:hypothetical protein